MSVGQLGAETQVQRARSARPRVAPVLPSRLGVNCTADTLDDQGPVPELTVTDVRRLIDKGMRPKFIDAREPIAQSAAGKIPGAIHVPLKAVDKYVAALPHHRPLIAYGTGDDDSRTAELARVLADRGFDAAYLRGGFAAWLEAGLPV